MLSVYVAGASKNIERAEAFMARVRGNDDIFEIAYDWTKDVRAAMTAGVTDHALTDEQRAVFAMQDMEGVLKADAFVLLAETPMSGGHPIELGMAIAQRRLSPNEKLIIVSGGERRSIFTSPWDPGVHAGLLVDYEVQDDDFAFGRLIEWANTRLGIVPDYNSTYGGTVA